MAENTKIEWCDDTFNPWIGCTKVGPGCDHCYAEADFDRRKHRVKWGAGNPRSRTSVANWKNPLQWNAQPFVECGACGWRGEKRSAHWSGTRCPVCNAEAMGPSRRRVFCASLADVFDNEVPAEWRTDLFDLIARTPNLDWLLVTKRIGNVERLVMDALRTMFIRTNQEPPTWPWANVWLGITVVNQTEADRDIPKLLSTPAAVRFLSMEPLLGPVDLTDICPNRGHMSEDHFSAIFDPDDDTEEDGTPFFYIDWVIVGGESGPGARPMHPQWARDIRDQCADAGVPFLFKQWGEWLPGENETHAPTGRKVAHHQDGRWGATDTKVSARNYVVWDESGDIHRGSLIDAPFTLRVVAWAERVGKKAAGRLLDGREHSGFPMQPPKGEA